MNFEDYVSPWKTEGDQWTLWEFAAITQYNARHPREIYYIE